MICARRHSCTAINVYRFSLFIHRVSVWVEFSSFCWILLIYYYFFFLCKFTFLFRSGVLIAINDTVNRRYSSCVRRRRRILYNVWWARSGCTSILFATTFYWSQIKSVRRELIDDIIPLLRNKVITTYAVVCGRGPNTGTSMGSRSNLSALASTGRIYSTWITAWLKR